MATARPARQRLRRIATWLVAIAALHAAALHAAAEPDDPNAPSASEALRTEAADVAREVAELERDLRLLEEDLLYPASSKIVVYVSMARGTTTQLDAVTLSMNGKEVARRVYDEKALTALGLGGVDRLYVGNAAPGQNVLEARFEGRRSDGKPYRRESEYRLEKTLEPGWVEFEVSAETTRGEPEIHTRP